MAKRGKSIDWTPEQDEKILSGEKVDGTPVQIASRRYRLRTNYLTEISRQGQKLLDRLKRMRGLGMLPKSVTAKFLRELATVVEDLNGSKASKIKT